MYLVKSEGSFPNLNFDITWDLLRAYPVEFERKNTVKHMLAYDINGFLKEKLPKKKKENK